MSSVDPFRAPAIDGKTVGAKSMRPPLQRISLVRERVTDWTAYPFAVPAIAAFERLDLTSRVLFFVGENGTGKSTLLEAIALACGFGREGGTRNFTFSTQSEPGGNLNAAEAASDKLADALRLSWTTKRQRDGFFLRAESFYNVATYLERNDLLTSYGHTSFHHYSHGEAFLKLLMSRFSGQGLYLIDEPEAALSAARQLALLVRMRTLLECDEQTQFIIATHSPLILAYPGAQLLTFDRGEIQPVTYRDTDAFVITRRFLADPERAFRELFTPEADA